MPEPRELWDELHPKELERLGKQVEFDREAALIGHQERMRRFARYYQLWRNVADEPIEDENEPTYRVPMVQSDVFAKWAGNLDSLFGDDAEITAEPIGPSDVGTARKVGAFIDWRVFTDMKLVNRFAEFEHRKILLGRSHAYCPWEKRYYWVTDRDPMTGARARRRVLAYEGPGFYPLHPDDLLVPTERVTSIQDFSFVIRKFRCSPQDLLDGEADGLYNGITDNWDKIVQHALVERELDDRGDRIKFEEQFLEGVNYDGVVSGGERSGKLTVYEWFGYWRLPKNLKGDVSERDWKKRDRVQSHLRVFYIPACDLVIGVDDLADLYPNTEHRVPIKEASLTKDGTYWCMGLGEMLIGLEDEATHVHRIFMQAGEFSAGPLIVARPGSGLKRGETRYRPWTVLWSEDPGGINMLQPRVDHNWSIAMGQSLVGWKEKKDGITDQTVGRSIDRPNAPDTARGQLALIEQGNIRASIDTRSLREDFGEIVSWFWTLESMFGSENTFFRVTEEDAAGLFDVSQGGSTLTQQERAGRYDFRVKFATSYWSREAQKQRFLELYALLTQNPLVVSNPILLGQVTRDLCKTLGHPEIAALIPMPQQIDVPRTPSEEWNLMLQGQDVEPHPADNDPMHLVDHQRQLQLAMQAAPDDAFADPDALMRLQDHILKTQIQIEQKRAMQGLAAGVMQAAMNQNGPLPAQTNGGERPSQGNDIGDAGQIGPGDGAPFDAA